MAIRLKRAYDPPSPEDGTRVLVDRLWPRGISKEKLKLDAWMKELAPSTALRTWYHHAEGEWEEFQRRYFKELDAQPESVESLRKAIRSGTVTLVYSSKFEQQNNAVALKQYLEGQRH